MLSIHIEFHPIWSSRRDAVASPDLEIIDGIYCTQLGNTASHHSASGDFAELLGLRPLYKNSPQKVIQKAFKSKLNELFSSSLDF